MSTTPPPTGPSFAVTTSPTAPGSSQAPRGRHGQLLPAQVTSTHLFGRHLPAPTLRRVDMSNIYRFKTTPRPPPTGTSHLYDEPTRATTTGSRQLSSSQLFGQPPIDDADPAVVRVPRSCSGLPAVEPVERPPLPGPRTVTSTPAAVQVSLRSAGRRAWSATDTVDLS